MARSPFRNEDDDNEDDEDTMRERVKQQCSVIGCTEEFYVLKKEYDSDERYYCSKEHSNSLED